jgi:hypothetical protein
MVPSFTIQILGYNYNRVREIVENLSKVLSRNPRVADIEIDRLPWQAKEYEVIGYVDRGEVIQIWYRA